MKWMQLLIWLTQLGISVVGPLVLFVLLAVWLQQKFSLGIWIVLIGTLIGFICAADGLRTSLKLMKKMAQDDDKKKEDPPLSFNDHE